MSDMRDWLKSEICNLKSEICEMKKDVEGIGEHLKEEVDFTLEEILYLLHKLTASQGGSWFTIWSIGNVFNVRTFHLKKWDETSP